jgi:hypothetical protein
MFANRSKVLLGFLTLATLAMAGDTPEDAQPPTSGDNNPQPTTLQSLEGTNPYCDESHLKWIKFDTFTVYGMCHGCGKEYYFLCTWKPAGPPECDWDVMEY